VAGGEHKPERGVHQRTAGVACVPAGYGGGRDGGERVGQGQDGVQAALPGGHIHAGLRRGEGYGLQDGREAGQLRGDRCGGHRFGRPRLRDDTVDGVRGGSGGGLPGAAEVGRVQAVRRRREGGRDLEEDKAYGRRGVQGDGPALQVGGRA